MKENSEKGTPVKVSVNSLEKYRHYITNPPTDDSPQRDIYLNLLTQFKLLETDQKPSSQKLVHWIMNFATVNKKTFEINDEDLAALLTEKIAQATQRPQAVTVATGDSRYNPENIATGLIQEFVSQLQSGDGINRDLFNRFNHFEVTMNKANDRVKVYPAPVHSTSANIHEGNNSKPTADIQPLPEHRKNLLALLKPGVELSLIIEGKLDALNNHINELKCYNQASPSDLLTWIQEFTHKADPAFVVKHAELVQLLEEKSNHLVKPAQPAEDIFSVGSKLVFEAQDRIKAREVLDADLTSRIDAYINVDNSLPNSMKPWLKRKEFPYIEHKAKLDRHIKFLDTAPFNEPAQLVKWLEDLVVHAARPGLRYDKQKVAQAFEEKALELVKAMPSGTKDDDLEAAGIDFLKEAVNEFKETGTLSDDFRNRFNHYVKSLNTQQTAVIEIPEQNTQNFVQMIARGNIMGRVLN
jgi:hypothetical protein